MDKHYITAADLLRDSFKLAEQIFSSGFRPNFIGGVWRGGAPVGIAVQEYLEYKGLESDHIAIRTSSYYGIDQQSKEVRVHGLQYIVDRANHNDHLLIVSGRFRRDFSLSSLRTAATLRPESKTSSTMRRWSL